MSFIKKSMRLYFLRGDHSNHRITNIPTTMQRQTIPTPSMLTTTPFDIIVLLWKVKIILESLLVVTHPVIIYIEYQSCNVYAILAR